MKQICFSLIYKYLKYFIKIMNIAQGSVAVFLCVSRYDSHHTVKFPLASLNMMDFHSFDLQQVLSGHPCANIQHTPFSPDAFDRDGLYGKYSMEVIYFVDIDFFIRSGLISGCSIGCSTIRCK